MKKHLTTILLFAALLAGAALLAYPTFSNYWNSFHQTRAIASYNESVAAMTAEDYEKLWQSAVEYNTRHHANGGNLHALSESETEDYLQQLDVAGNGVMGYIEIPKINVSLPIYHGTSEGVLQIAVGHLDNTSLPVGGESTHAVLSGHRGLPSAKLFTDLDDLDLGDVFLLRILNETLTYEVDQIHIVEPQEVEDLAIQEGRDLCTLVTCTPYGINSHRMLVRGTRTENANDARARVTADAIRIDPILVAPIAAIPMLLLLLVILLGTTGRKKPKKKKKTTGPDGPVRQDGEPREPGKTPKGGRRRAPRPAKPPKPKKPPVAERLRKWRQGTEIDLTPDEEEVPPRPKAIWELDAEEAAREDARNASPPEEEPRKRPLWEIDAEEAAREAAEPSQETEEAPPGEDPEERE